PHRHEYGMAPEPVAKAALLPIVFPFLLQELRNRVMMDGKEEIRSQRIGALNPFDESGSGGSECIEHERTTKAGLEERSLDLLGEKKVELVLGRSARALRAWDVDSVSYIEGNT